MAEHKTLEIVQKPPNSPVFRSIKTLMESISNPQFANKLVTNRSWKKRGKAVGVRGVSFLVTNSAKVSTSVLLQWLRSIIFLGNITMTTLYCTTANVT
ncbi:hypothetical protein Scep_018183 [Stephania cephalantha]|uniref:Uncharacterized protein n=1 Tax=Stephania cephalantha TaxID=152367 RepID=A0AAP0IRX1_9MAGN